MKRILCVFIAIVLLFVLCTSVIALDDNPVTIELENITSSPGSQVKMKINVKNNLSLASTKLFISYDSELTLVGVTYDVESYAQTQGVSVMVVPYGENYFPKSAEACINWVSLGNVSGDFTIATLTFEIASDAEEKDYIITATCDGDDIYSIVETEEINRPFNLVNGKVTVKNYIPGDLNNDTFVNIDDVIYLLYHYYFGSSLYPVNQPCDFTKDENVNIDDVIYLLYHYYFGSGMYPLV